MEHKKNDKEMKTALVLLLPIFIFTMLAIVGFTVAGYFAFLFLGLGLCRFPGSVLVCMRMLGVRAVNDSVLAVL